MSYLVESRHSDRRGITLLEVIVLIGIIVVVFLFLLMLIPRGREQARLTGCQKNLGQIGVCAGDV